MADTGEQFVGRFPEIHVCTRLAKRWNASAGKMASCVRTSGALRVIQGQSAPSGRLEMQQRVRAAIHGVKPTAAIQTGQLMSYEGVGGWFDGKDETVNHQRKEYVRWATDKKSGKCVLISTNEAESFFALLKRGITGSFHCVCKEHLHLYCDEFSFRWNERDVTDAEWTLKRSNWPKASG